MVTTVGQEADFNDVLTNLIHLERDAIAAYDAVIMSLADRDLRRRIDSFKDDHLDHLETLTRMAREAGAEAPAGTDAKAMLTTGKIALADLAGDGAILRAMKTNEDDTVTAYGRALRHDRALPRSRAFFDKALADEERHRDWMQETARSL